MNEQKTQIAHAIFQQEDLDAAVLTYRERVREGDPPELKNMLRKQALDAHCPLSFENLERAKSVLGQLVLADTEKMFEPETETDEADADPELTGERTPESLQSAVLELLTDPATDAGEEEGWTSAGIAYRLDEEHETVKAVLQTLIDAGKAICREAETLDDNLYFTEPDKADADKFANQLNAEGHSETSEPETETDKGDEPSISPDAQRVLDVMPDKYWTVSELSEHLGETTDFIFAAIDELRNAGKVEPVGNQQYRIVLSDEEYNKLLTEHAADIDAEPKIETTEPETLKTVYREAMDAGTPTEQGDHQNDIEVTVLQLFNKGRWTVDGVSDELNMPIGDARRAIGGLLTDGVLEVVPTDETESHSTVYRKVVKSDGTEK